MTTILRLASAANEAVIAYRATNQNHFEALLCATRRLIWAVDMLTGAIVEEANR